MRDKAFVLMGSPGRLARRAGRPLDDLRREMNAANVLHKYHVRASTSTTTCTWWSATTPTPRPPRSRGPPRAVRDKLATDPVDLTIGPTDIKIVAADSHTLAPSLFVGDVRPLRPPCSRS